MPASERRLVDVRLLVVGFVFCLSGASALVYQVSWQRILALHSGVGIYSVAVIVAAFLAGLGIGSWVGGVLSVRTPPATALRLFACLEFGVAAFALASCHLYYDLLYMRAPGLFADLWPAAALHFLLLLVSTALMGMSLPFLVRAMVLTPATASATVGYLYGINVLGASAGALLAPWVLIRHFGIEGAVFAAAAGNATAGAAALLVARLPARPAPVPRAGVAHADHEPAGSRPFALWLALYALTGFAALSLEIIWFRVVDVAVKSTAFTFGTVLAVYLLGLGIGSLAGGRLALRARRPLAAFLLCQCLLLAYAGAALTALVSLPVDWSGYRDLVAHWRQYQEFALGEIWDWRMIALLYVALPVGLYGPPTVLMGVSFGLLQRAVHDEETRSGLRVGILQAGNIAGNVAGSLLTGLLLLEVFGTPGAVRAQLGVGAAFAALGIYYYGWRGSFPVLFAVLAALIWVTPPGHDLWLRLHGELAPALFAEDATAVAAIAQDGSALRVSVNGKGNSWLPFGGIHSQLGAVPAVIHPAPERAAIVGLGSADTAWAAAFRPETRHVTVFELSAGQIWLLERTAEAATLPQLAAFLADPRVEIVVADGRNRLAGADETYDLIEADALRPNSAYSGNLYSAEFFALAALRLRPGGIMCTWVPTLRVYSTFCRAFPHVYELLDGQILIGSNDPIPIDRRAWAVRLDAAARGALGPHVAEQVRQALASLRPATAGRCEALESNRDLFPRDEFQTPRHR